MKCQQARTYLSPYLDSELDPTTMYEVSRHLEGCPDCAQLFASEEELEHAIHERLRRPQGDEDQVIEQALSHVFAQRSWFMDRRAFFAAACLFLLLGLFAYRVTTSGSEPVPELITMAAEDHRGYILGEITPELLTHDPAAVASFFQGQLAGETGSFPTGNGWEIAGARVCRFGDIPVGFVTLHYHGIPISVVDVVSEDAKRATEHEAAFAADDRCFELQGGRGILRRTPFGFRVAFGDVEMAKLEEVVKAAR